MAAGKKTLETLTLKPSELAIAIEAIANTDVSMFIWGPPGIGKSAIMQEFAFKQNRPFIDLRLSQMDPTDLRGIPYPTVENGVHGMRWSAPLVLPRDPDSNAVIALEEFNAAPQSVMAASYQLVLDRKLGEYSVPKNCIILAAGNRETDKGIAFKMPTPISNRLVHIEMRHDFEDFHRHAVSKMFNPMVVGFLSAFKGKLFNFDPSTASRGFETPRSWEFVSKILNANPDLPEAVLIGLLVGAVGDAAAMEFHGYRDLAASLPPVADILSGKLREMTKKPETQLCYALVTMLCYELRIQNENMKREFGIGWKSTKEFHGWLKQSDNFLQFMMTNFNPEVCIMGAKTAIGMQKLPFDNQKMKVFDLFASNFKGLILD